MTSPASINPNRRFTLLSGSITSAVANQASDAVGGLAGARSLAVQGKWTSTSAPTSVDAFLQCSLDSGANWIDVAQWMWSGVESGARAYNLVVSAVTSGFTPASGGLADNTSFNGILGERVRVLYTTVGDLTTAGTLTVNVVTGG